MKAKVNGVQLNYRIDGEGFPVVLTHGLGWNMHVWDNIANQLTRESRVFRMDLRGFGDSDKPLQPELSIELWAEDINALLETLKVKGALIVGHSMAASITVKLALDHPDKASALCLLAGASKFGPEGQKILSERAVIVEREGMSGIVDRIVATNFPEAFVKANPKTMEEARRMLLSNNPHAYAQSCRAIIQFDFTPDLPRIGWPTLIMAGELDKVASPALSESLNKAIPRSYLKILPDTGHLLPLEKPAEIGMLLKDFLKLLK
ncbi:MAG: alpha/beta fold hydrolase [Candidatus Bathyarchaeia archaeon]